MAKVSQDKHDFKGRKSFKMDFLEVLTLVQTHFEMDLVSFTQIVVIRFTLQVFLPLLTCSDLYFLDFILSDRTHPFLMLILVL